MLAPIAIGLDWRISHAQSDSHWRPSLFYPPGTDHRITPATCTCSARDAEQRLKEQIQQNTADLERAQAAERQLEAVLEQSADGVFITENKNQTIMMANRAFLELVGMSREELIGNEPYCFVPEVGKTYQTTLGEEITIDMQYYEDHYAHPAETLNRRS